MTIRTPSYLKSRFENGDIPQSTDYEDVFDSFLSLATSGAQTIDGILTVNGLISPTATFSGVVSADTIDANNIILDAEYSIDARATTQASARLLSSSINWVTSANGNNFAVILASAVPGKTQYIINNTVVTALRVFPCVGGSFVGTASNASMSIPLNRGATIIHGTSNTYVMIVGS
jgi:hypothetical protein